MSGREPFDVVERKAQTSRFDVLNDNFFQARLVDRQLTTSKPLHLARVDVDAHDLVAFERHYHEGVDSANELHRRWQKEWIVWKLPDTPPPDLDLTPRG